MSLLAPAFLWSLLALIPLAAVYFLKVRPRRRTTTAYFLWDRILEQKQATSLLQRLRDVLSLLLMLLAFAAVSFALAKPEFTADERKDLLLLVDRSASMSAMDGGKTRLERAKEAALDIVAALDGNQRAAVASVARDLVFHSHLSDSPRELAEAVRSIGASDFPSNPAALRAFGEDFAWAEDHRILLLSDAAFEGAAELPEGIELLKVGAPAKNAGIVAADLRRLPDGILGFFFRVASSFPEPVEADLVLKHEGSGDRIFKLIPLRIEPGENPPERFTVAEAPSGAWTATLQLDDALDGDDHAYLAVPEPRPVRVSVATADRFFFEVSVLAFERGSGILRLVEEAAEVVVGKGAVEAEASAAVIFSPEGESPWWDAVGGEVEVTLPRVLLADHPAIRHLDPEALSFAGARELSAPPGSLVLVASESGVPLIYLTKHQDRSALVANLDPVVSELVLSPWFPVLIHGAALHLAGRDEEPAALHRPGDTVPVPGYREGHPAVVTPPGSEEGRVVEGRGFGPLERLGFYTLDGNAGRWLFGSSLATRAESLLDHAAIPSTAKPLARGHAPAHWLILFALLLLVAESVLYHRRKVG